MQLVTIEYDKQKEQMRVCSFFVLGLVVYSDFKVQRHAVAHEDLDLALY